MRKKILGVQFNGTEADLIERVAGQRGETVSSFLRRSTLLELARLSYLPADVKKSLGLEGTG